MVFIDFFKILVNVPDLARFAIRELIVSGERKALMHTRCGKDLKQAAQVFLTLLEDRPGDIRIAWNEIRSYGKDWVKRVQNGVSALGRFVNPVIEEKIGGYLK